MGKVMLRLGFEELNLSRVTACCDAENAGSWRVMEKLGMRREGLVRGCRRAHKRSSADRGDEVIYTITRNEWETGNRTEP